MIAKLIISAVSGIQVARLSGFSPIITTASPHNTDFLLSIGATHVLDRKLSASALAAEVKKITSKPIKYIYEAISIKETQNAAYDILAPGGKIVIVTQDLIDKEKLTPDKQIVCVSGNVWFEDSREIGVSLYKILPKLLEDGDIKVNISTDLK